MTTLTILRNLERGPLGKMLADPRLWESVLIDYEPPIVQRLWAPLPDGARVFLHSIWPCKEALFHPHPWPSAVKIVSGCYEMQVGTSCPTRPVVKPVCTLQLPAGTYYEMDDEAGWHSVRPLGGPSLSLMVTLAPWKNPVPFPKPQKALLTLTRHEQDRLLHDMREALFL